MSNDDEIKVNNGADIKGDAIPDTSGYKQVERDKRGRILPGHTGNPAGRPKGIKSMKDFFRNKFAEMTDEEKELWMKTHKVSGETIWKMAEGNPEQKVDADIKSTIVKELLDYDPGADKGIVSEGAGEDTESPD